MSEVKSKLVKFTPLSLTKELEEDSATLQWSIRKGYPRITVFTSNTIKEKDGTVNYGKIITAPFDYVTMTMFLNYFQDVIFSKEETRQVVNCYNVKYKDGEKTEEIYLQAKAVVGKDKDGIIYITAIEEEKKQVKFYLLPNTKWHKIYDKDNNEISNVKEQSFVYAKAYLQLLRKLIEDEFMKDAKSEILLDNKNKQLTKTKDEVEQLFEL